jgi:hypothetical protein
MGDGTPREPGAIPASRLAHAAPVLVDRASARVKKAMQNLTKR